MNHVRYMGKAAKKLGFTLIELSIVLVIIGLIVGGILVGQDLIKAAEVRATVGQMEKYSAAVNTFRSKYNGLPGDLLNASTFGFDTGRTASHYGNSLLESSSGTSVTFGGETSCFWDDLSTASLISENLNASAGCSAAYTISTVANSAPLTKLGRGNYLIVGNASGFNIWGITGITSIASGVYTLDDLLTGSEAFQIDSKIDDGAPTSGGVIAIDGTDGEALGTADTAQSAGAGVCVLAGNVYNFTTSSGNDQGCQLRSRASF